MSSRETGQLSSTSDHDVLVVALVDVVDRQHRDAGNAREGVDVVVVVALVHGDHFVDHVEVREPHGRAHLVHLAVRALGDDVVVAGEPEVAHQPDGVGEVVVVRDDRAALDGVEELGGVEAQDLGVAERCRPAAPCGDAERVCGVEDQVGCRSSRAICSSSATGAGRPQRWTPMIAVVRGVISRAHRLRIQVVRVGVDVGEDRCDPVPLQRVRGRDEGERRDDDLAGQSERPDQRSRGRSCRC